MKADQTRIIQIGEYDVSIREGGLYDRFRSNPPLSVIKQELPSTDLSWFRQLPKNKIDMGFESFSPNFYYDNSLITAVFTADLASLTELMPKEVLAHVQPLRICLDRGLVAITAYAYHYCDNDSYNEFAISIITNKPNKPNRGSLSLIGQAISRGFWGYVLKLPVNTELAKVRGVVGYNLPKWQTQIDQIQGADSVHFDIYDQTTGALDLVMKGRKLANLSKKESFVTNSFTNLNQNGELTFGYAVSRQLRHASSRKKGSVELTLHSGHLSRFIQNLGLGSLVKYEYVPMFQSALYAPQPLNELLK